MNIRTYFVLIFGILALQTCLNYRIQAHGAEFTQSSVGSSPWCLVTGYGFKACIYESLGACQEAATRREGICVYVGR